MASEPALIATIRSPTIDRHETRVASDSRPRNISQSHAVHGKGNRPGDMQMGTVAYRRPPRRCSMSLKKSARSAGCFPRERKASISRFSRGSPGTILLLPRRSPSKKYASGVSRASAILCSQSMEIRRRPFSKLVSAPGEIPTMRARVF